MCGICDLTNQPPLIEPDARMRDDVFAKATEFMIIISGLRMSDVDTQYATTLVNFIGMQDTMINLLLQTGNPDAVPRLVNLMIGNTAALGVLILKYSE